MSTRTLLTPGTLSPRREVPAHIPRPEYVGKPAPTRSADPWVQPPEIIEAMRRGRPDRGAGAAGRRRGRRSGVTTDEVDRVVHEFLVDHDALPVDAGLPRLPEVVLHEPERGHLPRHPRLHRDPGRRHRQHRRHRVHRRRPRRHQRHLPRRRRRGGGPAAGRAHPRGDHARDQGGPARAGRSTSSAGSSRATPAGSATAWCATSPATASAATSTPASWCCTTTTRR